MKNILITGLVLYAMNFAFPLNVSAEILCAKNKKEYEVKNKLITLRPKQFLKSETSTCPTGYTAVFSPSTPTPTATPTNPETLKSGQTITGAWSMGSTASGAGISAFDSISFSKRPTTFQTSIIPLGQTSASCSGNVGSPTAAPGMLCIYIGYMENCAFNQLSVLDLFASNGVNMTGMSLSIESNAAGIFRSSGAWALTGE